MNMQRVVITDPKEKRVISQALRLIESQQQDDPIYLQVTMQNFAPMDSTEPFVTDKIALVIIFKDNVVPGHIYFATPQE